MRRRDLTIHCLLIAALAGAACAEDPVLKQRIAAIRAREAAADVPRLAISLTSGGNRWCPLSVIPTQVRVTREGRWPAQTSTMFDAQGRHEQPGTLSAESVQLRIRGASLTADWLLMPPPRPQDVLALGPVTIAARLDYDPALSAELPVTTTFDCDQAIYFAGRPGRVGVNGGRGEDGEDGPKVAVAVGYVRAPAGEKLILVKVTPPVGAPGYAILAAGRHLIVDVRGGPGGMGGAAPTGAGTLVLTGGLGGNGGNGGTALIRVDARFLELQSVVSIANQGGGGGYGGLGNHGDLGPAGLAGRAGTPPRSQTENAAGLFADEIAGGLPVIVVGASDSHI